MPPRTSTSRSTNCSTAPNSCETKRMDVSSSVVQLGEQHRERLLRVDVHARRRLVEHEQVRLARERLRDERALLLPAGQRGDGLRRSLGEAHSLDGRPDEHAVAGAEAARRDRAERRAPWPRPPPRSRASRSPAAHAGRGSRSGSAGAARPAGSPKSDAVPACGCSRPSRMRSSVVLPPPFGPATATNSPSSTARLTSRSTGGPPGYAKVTPSSSASGTRAPPAASRGWRA